jgi:hypothetical protein
MNSLYQFLNGVSAMGTWACGVFFLNFWRKSTDRLFLIFAVSFWLMTLERGILIWYLPTSQQAESAAPVYFLRLLAFVMILFAIWDKNRRR